jgi:hypothetical protein
MPPSVLFLQADLQSCAARLPEGCEVSNLSSTPVDIKNVEPVLLPVPRLEGSRIARLIETNNAESPHAECYSNRPYGYTNDCHATRVYTQYGLSINIPRGVPVALFLTNRSNLRDSQVVKTKASRKRLCP